MWWCTEASTARRLNTNAIARVNRNFVLWPERHDTAVRKRDEVDAARRIAAAGKSARLQSPALREDAHTQTVAAELNLAHNPVA